VPCAVPSALPAPARAPHVRRLQPRWHRHPHLLPDCG